eukprot:scaffold3566_cov90-Skeletonema_dohrnii-CCMP3373.AAC.2
MEPGINWNLGKTLTNQAQNDLYYDEPSNGASTSTETLAVVLILSFSKGQNSLCILRADTVEASVAQLCCDFGQQMMKERKGGSPSLLRRNRPFLRVLF